MAECVRERAWAVNHVCASIRRPSPRTGAGLQEDTVRRWMGKEAG